MLGTLLARVHLATDGSVEAVRLGGDVIAPVATLRAIEGALAGALPLATPLASRVAAVVGEPPHFLLGATPTDVAAAVVNGAGR
jgi:hypothetical protein